MIVNAVDHDQDAGMVAVAVVDPDNNIVSRIGINKDGQWVHAERYAIEAYQQEFGNIPNGTVIVTTLSPCTDTEMELRSGSSCCDLIEELRIKEVYCGYYDTTQDYGHTAYKLIETPNPKIKELCQQIAEKMFERDEEDLKENFADGRVKGKSRPGRVKRAGASCNGSVTDLRAKAKRASGERAKMYHWCANMKSGKKNESALDEKWSKKYKSSIDCSHPKGFSQRAHCQGRKKK